jgi:hypothetical protein
VNEDFRGVSRRGIEVRGGSGAEVDHREGGMKIIFLQHNEKWERKTFAEKIIM